MVGACCKVARTADRYDLDSIVHGGDVDAYLRARWLGEEGYPETGTRPLTTWFNLRVLEAAYRRHDRRSLDTQLEADLAVLTDDDELDRGALIDDLAEDGIDGEALTGDLVSMATLYRHLTDHLDVEKVPAAEADTDWEARKVAYGESLLEENLEAALQSLENKGRLPGATRADVATAIELHCPACALRVTFDTALRRGYICPDHLGTGDP